MSKAVFGHSKSTIAMWEGSIERSLIPSGPALKSASSIRLEIAPIRLRNNRASFIVALNTGAFTVPSFLLVVSANELSNIGLTILSPGCPAVGASEELRGRLVASSRLDEPIKGFAIIALRTLCLCLGKSSDLLLFPTQNYDVLPFMGEFADYLVSSVTRIAALRAGHEYFLLHF